MRLPVVPGRRQLADARAAADRIIRRGTAANPAGTFIYANTAGSAFTFTPGATSFGAGSAPEGSHAALTIVPGQAVMLGAHAVSTELVS